MYSLNVTLEGGKEQNKFAFGPKWIKNMTVVLNLMRMRLSRAPKNSTGGQSSRRALSVCVCVCVCFIIKIGGSKRL